MKTGTYNFVGIDYPVNVISIKEMYALMAQEDFETFMRKVLTVGGFWMTELTSKDLEASQQMFKGRVSDEVYASIAQTQLGLVICCTEEFAVKLTEREFQAILKHEEAHVKMNHLQAPDNEIVNGAVMNVKIELEADAYAAEAFGKDALRSGLLKMIEIQSEIFALADPSKTQEEFYQQLINDSAMQSRLAVLN